ncbi:MAG: formate dehydrogenase subunit alpha [Chloroflexi bacterium]|nr:formate dehydrogenase subunit alpha [Chloroflexota bacterium]
MDKMKLTIDGREVSVRRGAKVLEAAQEADIYIPTLCNHPELEPYGGCRMCLVEIEKMRGFPPACSTPAAEGMVVKTVTPELTKLRQSVLELLLTEHPHPCLTCHRKELCGPFDVCLRSVSVTERCVVCPKNKRCQLKDVARYIGLDEVSLPYTSRGLPIHTEDPCYDRDYDLCILCGRCVRVCDEVVGASALAFVHRGSQALVGTAFGQPLTESGCVFCGACVEACPTGTLMEKDGRWAGLPDRTITTICNYCGVGCQLRLAIKDNRILRVHPDPQGPSNKGLACSKGKFGLDFVHHPDRLTKPLIKRDGKFQEATWEEALSLVVQRLSQYEGDSFAMVTSAKATNEDNYVMQKFARETMGTNNVDHCARLCHAPTVAGLAQTLGSGAMTNSIADLAQAKTILVIGSNTTATHPVIGFQVRRLARKEQANLLVADPREIDLVRDSTLWLRQRSGTDVALLMGMARVILDEGLADMDFVRERCENFEAFQESLQAFDLETVSQTTGIPAQDIARAARLYATQKPSAILYAMGITQHSHGTDNVMASSNLALLTGNIGVPGAGVNPLRGHSNVQGACDMGGLPNVYPGYQSVGNPEARAKFEAGWGCSLPDKPGLTLMEMWDAALDGRLKAVYLVGENPVLSDADASHVEKALKNLEFLVVQDIFLTETARLADVVLPAATFAEKDGTFTNTERRVQRLRIAVLSPGEARPDWLITCQIAQRMGAMGFDFQNPEEIMEEIARLTPSYGGISYPRLESGGLQWPCPTPDHPGTPILHVGRFTRGKGWLAPLRYRPSEELPDKEYPLVLTTARLAHHFHTGTMTRKAKGLAQLRNEELAEVNPQDAERLGIQSGDAIYVASRRGRVTARARVTEDIPFGEVAMSFHFAETATNMLTNPALDPLSKMPEFKVCAVKVGKAT